MNVTAVCNEIMNILDATKMTLFLMLVIWTHLILCCARTADTDCSPVFNINKKDTLRTGGSAVFFCDISSCQSFSKVVYEKTDVVPEQVWTPVYEGNSYRHYALDTGTAYDLTGRVDRVALSTHFLFEVRNITVKDCGKWRCIVLDQHNDRHESNHKILTVVSEKDVAIKPKKNYIVAGQAETFTCEIRGIYPAPTFEWTLNGTTYLGNTTHTNQHRDGLWYMTSTAKLEFYQQGTAIVTCVLATTAGDRIVGTNIIIDVKAPANITNPWEEILIEANASKTVVLMCSGVGFRPRIKWERNGVDIEKDSTRYILNESRNKSACTGTLTLKPLSLPLTCENVHENDGAYTCTVSLKLPYKSKKTSKPIKVKMLHKPLVKEGHKGAVIESNSVILRCEVCSDINITSEWTLNDKLLQGDNVEYKQDGSVKLTGYHPFGAYKRVVSNSVGSVHCMVHFVNSEHPPFLNLIYSALGVLGLLVVILIFKAFCKVGTIKERIKRAIPIFRSVLQLDTSNTTETDDVDSSENLLSSDIESIESSVKFLATAPKSVEFENTISMTESVSSIWGGSTNSNRVFVGGETKPTITVINDIDKKTTFSLNTGTRILCGLFLKKNFHLVNVYDKSSNDYSVQCISVDATTTMDEHISPISTLDLSSVITRPGCLFTMDDSCIGIFCVERRVVAVFNLAHVLSATNPVHDRIIELDGFEPDIYDSLCCNPNGEIYVLSFKSGNLIEYQQGTRHWIGATLTSIPEPIYMQCFMDNSLVVASLYGDIHRVAVEEPSQRVALGQETPIQAALFTCRNLWIVDEQNSNNIKIYKIIAT